MLQNVKQKKVAAIAISTTYFTAIALISIYIYQKLHNAGLCGINALCVLEVPLYYFIPLTSAISVFVGVWTYYLLSESEAENKEECKREEREKIKELINRLLSEKERAVYNSFEKETKQSEISKKLNLSRVETHRILKRLEEKGLIKRERKGKIINVIKIIL
jgi:uncharacterized membrane protein